MGQLVIENANKIYDNKVHVLKDIKLSVEKGEFVVLVGPSGCGKSTLLRMIAGLEDITSGTIKIGERVVNKLPPADRDIAMVFQDYALYPHMTVEENLSFGLRMRKRSKDVIEERVKKAAKMLEIEKLLQRRPSQLSGGQRQRVAIGRAIVRKASLFLFDEPLSNLDAQLRNQTRIELADLHESLGATSVYVTHDQVEAMTLADKIVVLNAGNIQQVGSPLELYEKPANLFVASFIGNPSMNFFKGELCLEGDKKTFTVGDWKLDVSQAQVPAKAGIYTLGIRPETIKVLAKEGREAEGNKDLDLMVTLLEPHGHEVHMVCNVAGQQTIVRSANPKRLAIMTKAHKGDTLAATIDKKALHWFHNTEQGERVEELA